MLELQSLLNRKDLPDDVKNIIRKSIEIQKEASNRLSVSQRALTSLMNVNPESSILLNTDGIIIKINNAAAERIGVDSKNLIGNNIFDYFSNDIGKQRKKYCQNVVSTKKPILFEDKRNDIIFETSIHPVFNDKGQVEYLAIFSRDMTTQKRIEQVINESERRYRNILDSIEEGYFEVDLLGNMIFFNESTCKILRYSRDKLIGMNYKQFVDEKTAKNVDQVFNEVYKNKISTKIFDWEIIRKDGVKRIIETSVSLIKDSNDVSTGFRGVVRDITEKKMVEFALKESEEKYRNLVERANDGITIMQDKLLKYVNPSLARILGYNVEEILNTLFTDYLHPNTKYLLLDRYKRRMNGEDVPSIYESQLKTKNGDYVDVEINAGLINFQNLPADLVIVRDITERKLAERELKEAKDKYQMLVEKMEEGVLMEDKNGILQFVNPGYMKMIGYTKEELIGKHYTYFVAEEFMERVKLETYKRPKGITSTYECLVRKKDNTFLPVITTAKPLFSNDNKFQGVLAVITDITEQKKTEAMLKQTKLEEERYHAMLGHFINNNLQKIISNVELLYMQSKNFHREILEQVISITNQTSRTIDIVNKIFEVLQSSLYMSQNRVKIIDIIKEVVKKFPNIKNNIQLDFNSLDIFIYNDKYLKDVFSEIILYSIGNLSGTIESRKSIIIKGYQHPDHYCISISDDISTPISEELGVKLTGKISDQWESKGHHIGIALVSVIMQYYNGMLKIHPIIPKGNVFNLMFPLSLIEYSNIR